MWRPGTLPDPIVHDLVHAARKPVLGHEGTTSRVVRGDVLGCPAAFGVHRQRLPILEHAVPDSMRIPALSLCGTDTRAHHQRGVNVRQHRRQTRRIRQVLHPVPVDVVLHPLQAFGCEHLGSVGQGRDLMPLVGRRVTGATFLSHALERRVGGVSEVTGRCEVRL